MRKEPVFVPSTSDTRSTGSTRSVVLSLSLSLLVALLLLRARLPKHAAQASIQAVHPAGIRPADVGSSTVKPLAVSPRRAEQAPQSGSSTSSVACAPHHTGNACDRPLFPACSVMWGFELGLNPCANYPSVHEGLQFPLTCACLLQCDEHQAAARNDCIEASAVLPKTNISAGFSLEDRTPPWRGTPKGINWPELTVTYDPALVARLNGDSARGRAEGRCSGHGIWTVPLRPRPSIPPSPAPVCLCQPGFGGPDCGQSFATAVNRCMNRCSGAGRCVFGTCACEQRASGIDCSQPVLPPSDGPLPQLGASPPGRPETGALGRGHERANGPTGEPHSGREKGPRLPRIYVYDVPAHDSTWLALPHLGRETTCSPLSKDSCWWVGGIDPAYGADVAVLRRMLSSPHRTLHPEEADFFFVPLMLSIGFRSHRFGQYMPSGGAARLINSTIEHIKQTSPWWNASGGADHMLTLTGDLGACWLRARLPALEHMMFLTHWGYSCVGGLVKSSNGCVINLGFRSHHSGQDIVIPPLQRPATLLPVSPWLQAAAQQGGGEAVRFGGMLERGRSRSFQYLLYFVGKVHRSAAEGDSYSFGVRQRLFAWHANRSDFYLRERPGAGTLELDKVKGSKFCLAQHGVGFGMRQFNAIAAGCVPLVIQVRPEDDGIFGGTLEQVYEEVLPWDKFALRVPRSQLADLPRVLREVSAAEHEAMLRAAACVWPRLFWLHAFGGDAHDTLLEPPPKRCDATCQKQLRAAVPFDAFDTLMALLRRRLRRRGNASSAQGEHEDDHRAWHTPVESCMRALELGGASAMRVA
jgi:hypothetical protein